MAKRWERERDDRLDKQNTFLTNKCRGYMKVWEKSYVLNLKVSINSLHNKTNDQRYTLDGHNIIHVLVTPFTVQLLSSQYTSSNV